MTDNPKPVTHGGVSIKVYVIVWVGSILLSCLVLIVAWYRTSVNLREMKRRIFTDSEAVDVGRRLETTLLSERREDLLWRATQIEQHRTQRDLDLSSAERIAGELDAYATSPDEKRLVDEIRDRVRSFRAASLAEPVPSLDQLQPTVEGLLKSVRRYIDQNNREMEETIRAALQLHMSVDRWSIVLALLVGLVLMVGATGLVIRVLRPTFELTRVAAKFGQGDLAARAAVTRNDELGELSRTFNSMASDIEHREKERLEFVAMIAHDLMNPLVNIGGAARLLKKRPFTPDEQREWLDRMIAEVGRLEHLTQNLMDTAQVSTGRLALNRVEMDLAELVRRVQREQADFLASHKVTFDSDEECRIIGDQHRLERVVMNLLSNALKYSPEGSTVSLAVRRDRSKVVLSVADEGAGMTPDELAIIFQPFGRGQHFRTGVKGAGLGLAIVKRIVEAHGGTVAVESEPGLGTTFSVTLPSAGG